MHNLKFLISRLKWPSGMVRERACVAIADLLIDSEWSEIQKENLIDWVRKQSLESVAVIGLIPFLYAKAKSKEFVPPVEELLNACQKPSILSWILTNEMASHNIRFPNWAILNSGSAPDNFVTNPFFMRYARNFLPPIYMEISMDIQKSKDIPFVRQWAFEWHKILQNTSEKTSADSLVFRGHEHSEHYGVIDFKMSEIYRSAFLRALAWSIMIDSLLVADAIFFALKACPVDFGLWNLKPRSRPAWWPSSAEQSQIWKQVELVWKQRTKEKEWVIGEATGRVRENDTVCDLDIFGMLIVKKSKGNIDLTKLSDWYRYNNIASHREFSPYFEGIVRQVPFTDLIKDIGGLRVAPVSNQVWPHTIPRWQFWRMYRGIWIPAPFVGRKDLTFCCSKKGLIIEDGEGIIGKWRDWTDGLEEKLTANLSPATGQYLLVNRKRLEEVMNRTNSHYCWLCCLRTYHRQHDYEPYQQSTSHKIYESKKI